MAQRPPLGQGLFPRYGSGWMHQWGHLYALQQELLYTKSNWFRATELWHTARDEGVALNVSHYNRMLVLCNRAGQWWQALATCRQMRAEGIRLNVYSVGNALVACERAGRWEAALGVFEEYRPKLMLDSICHIACYRALAKGGKWEAAMSIAASSTERPLEALVAVAEPKCTVALLEACADAEQHEAAMAVHAYVKHNRKQLQEIGRGDRDENMRLRELTPRPKSNPSMSRGRDGTALLAALPSGHSPHLSLTDSSVPALAEVEPRQISDWVDKTDTEALWDDADSTGGEHRALMREQELVAAIALRVAPASQRGTRDSKGEDSEASA